MRIIKKIAIQCDLSSSSGLGHLSRMKNLSLGLEKKGLECFYLFNKKNKNYTLRHAKGLKTIFFQTKTRLIL